MLWDEMVSAITVKNLISGVINFIKIFMESVHSRDVIPLLKDLLQLRYSSSYNYWLVKCELCKLISEIPFTTLYHILAHNQIQEDCIEFLLTTLGDEDIRVREEAAEAVVTSSFHWPQDFGLDNANDSTVTCAAIKMASDLLLPIIGETSKDDFSSGSFRLVQLLTRSLVSAKTNYMTSGLIHVLWRLSEVHPPSGSPKSWGLKLGAHSPGLELLAVFSRLLSSRTLLATDMVSHWKLLRLSSNLYCGLNLEFLKAKHSKAFDECKPGLESTTQDIVSHCFKVINILSHLIDLNAPAIQPPKSQAPGPQGSVTNPTVSPIKKLPSFPESLLPLTSASPVLSASSQNSGSNEAKDATPNKKTDQELAKRLGFFSNSHHYLKLHETLRSFYATHASTLDMK